MKVQGLFVWRVGGCGLTREGLRRSDEEEMLWVWCGDDCL